MNTLADVRFRSLWVGLIGHTSHILIFPAGVGTAGKIRELGERWPRIFISGARARPKLGRAAMTSDGPGTRSCSISVMWRVATLTLEATHADDVVALMMTMALVSLQGSLSSA